MTVATGIMVYVVVWWLAWFAVLPIGVRVPDHIPTGQATSAPENPRLLWKAGLATVIAALLSGDIVRKRGSSSSKGRMSLCGIVPGERSLSRWPF